MAKPRDKFANPDREPDDKDIKHNLPMGTVDRVEGDASAPPRPEVSFVGAETDPMLLTETNLIQKIVKNKFCVLNTTYPEAAKIFEFSAEEQVIDRYYPLAEGGKLYVDEVASRRDKDGKIVADLVRLKNCEKKKEVMQRHKLRYLIFVQDQTTLSDVEQQLKAYA